MKRVFMMTCLLVFLCHTPGYSQFWINFGWGDPSCQNCHWMEHALHLNPRQADDYHSIVHKYGRKIEREARRPFSPWANASLNIFTLRF